MSFFKKSKGKKDLEGPSNEHTRPRRKSRMACVPFFSSSEALSPSEGVGDEDLDSLTEADILEDMRENLAGTSEMLPARSRREVRAYYVNKVLGQNIALRDNFEQLKQLFIALSDDHDALQEELEKLQNKNGTASENCDEMQKLQKQLQEQALTHAKEIGALDNNCKHANNLAAETQRTMKNMEVEITRLTAENGELMETLQRVGLDKEKLLIHTQAMELDHAREVVALKLEDKASRQQAGDLAHKNMVLQAQLDNALASAAASQEKVLALVEQRDASLDELEKEKRIMEEKRQEQISLREEVERKLQNVNQGMHAEEDRQRDLRRSLEAEITDLRGKIKQLEQSAHNDELKQWEGPRSVTTEYETLRRDLAESKLECRDTRHTLAAAEKESAKLQGENEVLRSQLQDAVVKYLETQSRNAENKTTIDELQRKLGRMKSEIEELNGLRSKDLVNQSRLMEDAQRSWKMEKTELVKREVSALKDERKKLVHEVHFLKKKLSQAYKLEANLTVSQNQLLVRVRELEVQLALAQGMKWSLDHPPEPTIDGIPAGKIPILNSCRDHNTWFKAEMEDLERRQTRCLSRATKLYSAKAET